MPTARDLVTSAARTARVIGGDEILDAADAQSILFTLNAMLQAWPADGIDFYHEWIDSLNDELQLPGAFLEGTRFLLAGKVAVDFGTTIDPQTAFEIIEAKKNLQAATRKAPEVKIDRALTRMWLNRKWGRYGWFRG